MPKKRCDEKMELISVHLPKEVLNRIDELVRQGRYGSRAEFIRLACQLLLTIENLSYIKIYKEHDLKQICVQSEVGELCTGR